MVSDPRCYLGTVGAGFRDGQDTEDWGPTSPVLRPRGYVKLSPTSLEVPELEPGLQPLGAAVVGDGWGRDTI